MSDTNIYKNVTLSPAECHVIADSLREREDFYVNCLAIDPCQKHAALCRELLADVQSALLKITRASIV
jgi:hypothetical protein